MGNVAYKDFVENNNNYGVIYLTTNMINGRMYIGKDSRNCKTYLGGGKNIKLAIKKYGKENFKKDILEICKIDVIDEREKYWISKYNAVEDKQFYNILIGGEDMPVNDMPVHAYSLEGYFIGSYESRKEACKKLGIIGKGNAIKNAVCGKRISAYGFQWRRNYMGNKISEIKHLHSNGRPLRVKCLDISGKVISYFNSIGDAVRRTGFYYKKINESINKNIYIKKGGLIYKFLKYN